MNLSQLIMAMLFTTTLAFVVRDVTTSPYRTVARASPKSGVCIPQYPETRLFMGQVDLVPEPEGGQELIPNNSMEGTRIKLMGEADGLVSDDGKVYKFWMRAVAQGELIKKFKIDILKESKKKANFPGFRKGQVPPWAMFQIEGFAIQEGIIKTVEQAVKAYGLTALPGSDGEVNVLEDVKEMCKGYKEGTSLEFTANLNCAMDPSRVVGTSGSEVATATATVAETEDSTTATEV